MEEDTKERLVQIITEALELEEQIGEDDGADTIEEWDSLGHLATANSVRKIFDILLREKLI